MLNEFDLTDEMVKDGLAFAHLMEDERTWGAIIRLLAQFNADAISRWETDDKDIYTKKWLRGYREALNDLSMRIAQRAQDAKAHVSAKVEGERVARVISDDGKGSGDLAIA